MHISNSDMINYPVLHFSPKKKRRERDLIGKKGKIKRSHNKLARKDLIMSPLHTLNSNIYHSMFWWGCGAVDSRPCKNSKCIQGDQMAWIARDVHHPPAPLALPQPHQWMRIAQTNIWLPFHPPSPCAPAIWFCYCSMPVNSKFTVTVSIRSIIIVDHYPNFPSNAT